MKDTILHRKDRLIITAIEIIDELGIQGLSTREISKRQGVSEATLFRHFRSKNELLLSVLEYYSKFDNEIYESAKLKNISPTEAIRYYISEAAEYYENYPEITAIMHLIDVLKYEPELSEKVTNIFNNKIYILEMLVNDAQKNGEIRNDISSNSVAFIISGFFRETCLDWRQTNRDYSLKERTLKMLEIIINCIGI